MNNVAKKFFSQFSAAFLLLSILYSREIKPAIFCPERVKMVMDSLPTEAELRARGFSEERIKNTSTKESFKKAIEPVSGEDEDQPGICMHNDN